MGNRARAVAERNIVISSVRTREYLTGQEIEALMVAAKKGSRYGHRDATMILIGYRHGLRLLSCAISNGSSRWNSMQVVCMSAE
jgi:type 1 fimbriae regulatory protein FimB/type 1 fimbriae regulatory protein FimE